MSQPTTNQTTESPTMRQLLARWVELEPERCQPCEAGEDEIEVRIKKYEWCQIILDDIITLDLMWIQWAVQEAVVSRGWRFNLYGFVSGLGYVAEIRNERAEETNPAQALLAAYLQALESTKKAG